MAALVLALFSFIFSTLYLFDDDSKTYALEKDLFVLPGYRPVYAGTERLLNRRVLDECEKTEDGDVSYVFICTTLWHEPDNELETLLKSLTRLVKHAKEQTGFSDVFQKYKFDFS